MSGLSAIPVIAEASAVEPHDWGNALPVLHEIRHALRRLRETGEPTLIDLQAIPFGPGDDERLLGLLGNGEVEATVTALGPTRVRETSFAGIWLVDHFNAENERVARHLEISTIPDILRSQPQDISDGADRLETRLGSGDAADG